MKEAYATPWKLFKKILEAKMIACNHEDTEMFIERESISAVKEIDLLSNM